jgi:dTDP-4-amino-4,6-dideoxygalactose transaminase
MHNAGRSLLDESRWKHVSLGWNCRLTEYQAGLLIHRFSAFDRQQAIRRKNFQYLRDLMSDVVCLEPLALHAGVRAHGMYMFAMRYKQEHCGGLPLNTFLDLIQAEGAPVYRAFDATISDQPGIQKLIKKRPEYFRRLPTPVADQATQEVVFIGHEVFLGTTRDMEDIAAAAKKVERHCSMGKTIERLQVEPIQPRARRPAVADTH